MKRLVIVADDFAGAADCAVVFAQRGYSTRAALDAAEIELDGWSVIAVDTDTRDAPAHEAHDQVRRAIAATAPEDVIFKKIDSTLRGNVASELRAVLGPRARHCVVAAPAFPATGRTTSGGRQLLDERPLEQSEFASQTSTSSVAELLAAAGLTTTEASRQAVRAGMIPELVRGAGAGTVVICDAQTDDDLKVIAQGALDSGSEIVWMGSAGLARGLAEVLALPPDSFRAPPPVKDRPLLLVVGSPARATQAQLRRLRETSGLAEVVIAEATDLKVAGERARAALESGCDCLVTLEPAPGRRDHGRSGTQRLANVTAQAAALAGGLALTGGETARAVLQAISAGGVTLQRELAPGIALGWTDPPASMPVALKAGGFGDQDALVTCRRAMRNSRTEDDQWALR